MKIEFEFLPEAFSRIKECPICFGDLVLAPDNLINYDARVQYSELDKLGFIIDYMSEDFIFVNPKTNDVKIYLHDETKVINTIYSSLIIECSSCFEYYFTLKLEINAKENKLSKINLNSEFIEINDNGVVYEIVNNYVKNKTFFERHSSRYNDILELPLVDLNLQKPLETINKINKMIVFL